MNTPDPQWRDRLERLESTVDDALARLEGLEQAWMRDLEDRRRHGQTAAPQAPPTSTSAAPPESDRPTPPSLSAPPQSPPRLSSLAYPTPSFTAQSQHSGQPDSDQREPSDISSQRFPHGGESESSAQDSSGPTPRPASGAGMTWGRSGADAPFAKSAEGPPLAKDQGAGPQSGATPFPGRSPTMRCLRQWGMAPPENANGENIETHLAMWWFTRLGALALVIGFVFAGTYISQYTSPWQRLLGLVSASAAVTVLGIYLKGPLLQFGHVVFGTGLAMLYFCAFAAHVVPAVKVIDSEGVAAFWQYAAVGLMVSGALWRRSPVIATMAVLLGYVSCGFALSEELTDFALVAALLLGAGAMGFHIMRRWIHPLIIAIPASLILFHAVSETVWKPSDTTPPGFWPYMIRVLAFVLVFAVGNCLGEWRGVRMTRWTGRILMSLTSFGFLSLGFLGVVVMYEPRLATFYFTTGAVWTALALAHHLSPHPSGMVDLYLVKGSTLIALGVITEFDARTRWIVLAVQSLVSYVSVRRTRVVWMEVFMTLVWMTSFLFFFYDLDKLGLLRGPQADTPLPTGYLMAGIGYVALSLILFCLYGRWSESMQPEVPEIGDLTPVRRFMIVVMSVTLGVALMSLIRTAISDVHLPQWMVLAALVVAATCLAGRHWSPLVASLPPLLTGHILVCGENITAHGASAAWTSSLLVVAMTLAAAGGLALAGERWTQGVYEKRRVATAEGALHLLWMVTLTFALYRLTPPETFALVLATLGLALLVASPALPWRGLTVHAPAPLILAAGALAMTLLEEGPELWATPMAPSALGGALACALALTVLATLQDRRLAALRQPAPEEIYARLLIPAAVVVIAFALAGLCLSPVRLAGYVALTMWLALVAHKWRSYQATALAICLLALAHLHACATLLTGMGFRASRFHMLAGLDGWDLATDNGFFMVLALAVATLALAALVRHWAAAHSAETQKLLQGVGGLAFLVIVFFLFLVQKGFRFDYATVFWGLAAIATLLTGFAVEGRELRLMGLAALLLCLFRAFAVDMQSALERIFAFIVLGLVMLFVGFLYTQRQSRSENGPGA